MACRIYTRILSRFSQSSAVSRGFRTLSASTKSFFPAVTHTPSSCKVTSTASKQQARRLCYKDHDNLMKYTDTATAISRCYVDEETRMLYVHWEDGADAIYPSIFLRDNCQCPLCFHDSTKQRLLDTARSVDLRIKPSTVKPTDNGKFLRIVWDDEHQSDFSAEWLRDRILPKTRADVKPRNVSGLKRVLWNSELEGKIREFDFEEVINDGKAQYMWLATLATTGVALLVNAPAQPGQLERLSSNSMGYIRLTNYGEVFTVKRKQQPSNLAYTVNTLPLHTDLPYYDYQPGLQLLHCIEQSGEGGDNQLVDGFHIANIMKEKYPDAFDVLTNTHFSFTDLGADAYGDYCLQFDRPVIGLDQFGNVESISHNNHVRDSYVNATAEDVKKSYEAYYILVMLMKDEENMIQHKMRVGDVLTFNNQRVLHGRTAYDATKSSRWLEGVYFDWDEAYSRMRVLAKRHGIKV